MVTIQDATRALSYHQGVLWKCLAKYKNKNNTHNTMHRKSKIVEPFELYSVTGIFGKTTSNTNISQLIKIIFNW